MFYRVGVATQLDSSCFNDAPPIAAEVARGVTRLLCRHDLFAICEMPLPNGRRADIMAIDAKGGLGMAGIRNTLPLTYDKYARRGAVFGNGPSFVIGICSVEELKGETRQSLAAPRRISPVTGVGLRRPEMTPLRHSTTSLFGRQPLASDSEDPT